MVVFPRRILLGPCTDWNLVIRRAGISQLSLQAGHYHRYDLELIEQHHGHAGLEGAGVRQRYSPCREHRAEDGLTGGLVPRFPPRWPSSVTPCTSAFLFHISRSLPQAATMQSPHQETPYAPVLESALMLFHRQALVRLAENHGTFRPVWRHRFQALASVVGRCPTPSAGTTGWHSPRRSRSHWTARVPSASAGLRRGPGRGPRRRCRAFPG